MKRVILASVLVMTWTAAHAADRTSQYTCDDVRWANANWSKTEKAKVILTMSLKELRAARACLAEKQAPAVRTVRCWQENC